MLSTSALRFAERFSLSVITDSGVTREEFESKDAYLLQLNRFAADVARGSTSLPTVEDGFQMVQVASSVAASLEANRPVTVSESGR
jgi:uncharacterized membrane protein